MNRVVEGGCGYLPNTFKIIDMKEEEKVKEPYWWADYKKANPKDKDEYNPRFHCCKRFWKDWCDCMKN